MTEDAEPIDYCFPTFSERNRRRCVPGNKETPEQLQGMLADELADAYIYLDLMMQAAGFRPGRDRGSQIQKDER